MSFDDKYSFQKSINSILNLNDIEDKTVFSECGEIFQKIYLNHFDTDKHDKNFYRFKLDDLNENNNKLLNNKLDAEQQQRLIINNQTDTKNSNNLLSSYANRNKKHHFLKKNLNKFLITNKKVEYLFIVFLLLDSISIALSVHIDPTESHFKNRQFLILNLIQYFYLVIFFIEIVSKIFIDSNSFWKSPWNIFDFLNLILSILLQFIDFYVILNKSNRKSKLIRYLDLISVFRIFKNLKLISHFIELRIILICLTRAVRSVVLISILLFILSFIFAKIGFIIFSTTNNNLFSSIFESLITLFAVMTLDQWWKIFKNTSENTNNNLISSFYFISWIILASFIFQNLFTGVMVNNFQQIRDEVVKSLDIKKIKKAQKESLKNDQHLLADKNSLLQNENSFIDNISIDFDDLNDDKIELKKVLDKMRAIRSENVEWNNLIGETIDLIKNFDSDTIWPEDSLLRYYEIMKILMDNLKERMLLIDLANQSLISMHDRDNLLDDDKIFKSLF